MLEYQREVYTVRTTTRTLKEILLRSWLTGTSFSCRAHVYDEGGNWVWLVYNVCRLALMRGRRGGGWQL